MTTYKCIFWPGEGINETISKRAKKAILWMFSKGLIKENGRFMSRIARVLNIPIIDDNLLYKYRLLNLFLFFLCGGVLPNLFVLFLLLLSFACLSWEEGCQLFINDFLSERGKKMRKKTMTMTQSKKVSSRFHARIINFISKALHATTPFLFVVSKARENNNFSFHLVSRFIKPTG